MQHTSTPPQIDNPWDLCSSQCVLRVEKIKPCLLLITIDGFAPQDFEAPLLQKMHDSCKDAYQLDVFIDLERARRFPVTSEAWIGFINDNAEVFKRIFVLATTKENMVCAHVVDHFMRRPDLIVLIKDRPLFDAWMNRLTENRTELPSQVAGPS